MLNKLNLSVALSILLISLFRKGNCDVNIYFDKIPLLIIRNVETGSDNKGLFSYSLTGASASLSNSDGNSKLFIGMPSISQDGIGSIFECDLKLQVNNNESGARASNHLKCNQLRIPQNNLKQSQVCKRDMGQFKNDKVGVLDDASFSSSLGSTLKYEASQHKLIACDFKWRTFRGRVFSPVRGMCYQYDVESKTISHMVFPGPRKCPPTVPTEDCEHHYYALQGFSVDYTDSNIVIGMPGYFSFRGAVATVDIGRPPNRNGKASSSCSLSQVTDSEDKDGRLNWLKISLDSFDYFGYSITSGNYLKKAKQLHAIGAPRGFTGKGKVFIIDVKNTKDRIIELSGDQFGSYFGSELASVDLNGDGFDELLVGAPMQNNRAESYDEGCVFVFSKLSEQTLGERWCPSEFAGGRFGSSIASLGDINGDKFGDVAISAPFVGTGRVYIYFGGSQISALKYLAIDPSPEASSMVGFGSTIMSKVDLDGNGTPDIAIGSYLSKSISVYLTRPRVVLSISFKGQATKYKRGVPLDLNPLVCAELNSTDSKQILPSELSLWLKVVTDSDFAPKNKRFFLASRNDSYSTEFPLKLQRVEGKEMKLCGSTSVTITANLTPDDKEKATFGWLAWYNETFREFNGTDVIHISKSGESSDFTGSLDTRQFCSLCPAPTEYNASSIVEVSDNCDDDGNPTCSPDVEITTSILDDKGMELTDITIGKLSQANVKITVGNKKETAYISEMKVRVMSGGDVDMNLFNLRMDSCVTNTQATAYELTCKTFTVHLNNQVEFKGIFDFGSLKAQTKLVKVSLDVQIRFEGELKSSETKYLSYNSEVNLDLIPNEQKEIALPDGETIDFSQQFEVINTKASDPPQVHLYFTYPSKYSNNSIVTFVSVLYSNGIESADCSKIQFKPTKAGTNQQSVTSDKPARLLIWGCQETNWTCETIKCTGSFPENRRKMFAVQLNLRINSAVARELNLLRSELKELKIVTEGSLEQFGTKDIISKITTQVFLIQNLNEGPAAIILVGAGAIGLILFFIVVFGLFKCGFFRRKTKEELQAMKAQTEIEKLVDNFPIRKPADSDEDSDGDDA